MSARTFDVKVVQAEDGWRWRVEAANGRVLADSGEAYTRKADAKKGARRLFGPDAHFVLWVPLREYENYIECEREVLR